MKNNLFTSPCPERADFANTLSRQMRDIPVTHDVTLDIQDTTLIQTLETIRSQAQIMLAFHKIKSPSAHARLTFSRDHSVFCQKIDDLLKTVFAMIPKEARPARFTHSVYKNGKQISWKHGPGNTMLFSSTGPELAWMVGILFELCETLQRRPETTKTFRDEMAKEGFPILWMMDFNRNPDLFDVSAKTSDQTLALLEGPSPRHALARHVLKRTQPTVWHLDAQGQRQGIL